MTEYLIAFNYEWVPDHTDEELREKARAASAVEAEMKAVGVFIFTGGLDGTAPCSGSMRRAARRYSPMVPTSSPRSTSAASPSWMWPTRRRRGCGRERSQWPADGRRRCTASGWPCKIRRLCDGIGGRSRRDAVLRALVGAARLFC